jgi:hypothetical protein
MHVISAREIARERATTVPEPIGPLDADGELATSLRPSALDHYPKNVEAKPQNAAASPIASGARRYGASAVNFASTS